MEDAEEILMTTMGDWEEKVNKGKTENLRMTGGRRAPYDVRREFETAVVRHLGAMHREDGDRCADTGKRISVAHALVRAIAKGWSIGTAHGRGRESGIDIPTRLQVLESCVMGALLFGCRTRGWTGYEVTKMQRVANYAVRRAFGMDTILMEELGLSDASMVKAAQWRTVEDRISRLSLSWLGHVARMPVWRHPKQVLFGFIEGRGGSEERNLRAWHTRWLRTRIRKLHTHEMDWFRGDVQSTKRTRPPVPRANGDANCADGVLVSPCRGARLKSPPLPLLRRRGRGTSAPSVGRYSTRGIASRITMIRSTLLGIRPSSPSNRISVTIVANISRFTYEKNIERFARPVWKIGEPWRRMTGSGWR